MREIKPGDIVLVKCKVTSIIITEDETVYNIKSADSDVEYGETTINNIITVSGHDTEITFNDKFVPIRGKYNWEE